MKPKIGNNNGCTHDHQRDAQFHWNSRILESNFPPLPELLNLYGRSISHDCMYIYIDAFVISVSAVLNTHIHAQSQ
jgi:hypothetical protein